MTVTLSRIMLFAAVMVFAVTGASAAPIDAARTCTIQVAADPVWDCTSQLTSFEHVNVSAQMYASEFDPSRNSSLADIGREMLKPSSGMLDETPLNQSHIKNLPALPGAVLMGVIGFLPVTLVRDRKFWMSIFAGLFFLSQTGMHAIPKLTTRLAQQSFPENQPAASLNHAYKFGHTLMVDRYECIHYTGLLHGLAGSPDEESALIKITGVGNTRSCVSPVLSAKITTQFNCRSAISLSQSALVARNYDLSPSSVYRTRRSKPLTFFSPAFIFEILPRGPPLSSV